jgi:hypothetical protein
MNPLDYLPAPREYFNAEVGDYVDPDEVFVSSCDICSSLHANPGYLHNPIGQNYVDLPEIKATIDQALTQFGIKPLLGSHARKVAVKFTAGGSSRAGVCAYNRRTGETRILLNRTAWAVFTPEQRLDTVLHEAAHAVEYILYGKSDHGPRWKDIARRIGCSSDRCLPPEASHAMRAAVAQRRGLPPPPAPTGETHDSFRVGDLVRFHVRGGGHAVGTIVKKSRVKAQVYVSGHGTYRVVYHIMTRLSGGAAPAPQPVPPRPTFVPTPRPQVQRPTPDYYFQTAVLENGVRHSSPFRHETYEAARETLSDFVTNTEHLRGQRVVEAAIWISEHGNPALRVVKTFRRKT